MKLWKQLYKLFYSGVSLWSFKRALRVISFSFLLVYIRKGMMIYWCLLCLGTYVLQARITDFVLLYNLLQNYIQIPMVRMMQTQWKDLIICSVCAIEINRTLQSELGDLKNDHLYMLRSGHLISSISKPLDHSMVESVNIILQMSIRRSWLKISCLLELTLQPSGRWTPSTK